MIGLLSLYNPSWSAVDGSNNASAGTAQYPTALTGFTARPPWSVAGVDYHVGIPSSTTLTQAVVAGTLNATLVSQGGSQTTIGGYPTVQFGTASQTITGWDFTGYEVLVNANNLTFTNCKFNAGSTTGMFDTSTGMSNLTIKYCEFTGGGNTGNQALLFYRGAGSLIFQYNWCHDLLADGINIVGGCTPTIQYNAFYIGAMFPLVHFNWFSFSGSGKTNSNVLLGFNFFTQAANGQAPGEGAQFYNNQSGSTLAGCSVANNTFLALTTNQNSTVRANNTSYTQGQIITVPGGNLPLYMCYTAGTSSSSQPGAYATTGIATNITDGTAVFQGYTALAISSILHGSNDSGFPTTTTGSCTITQNYYGGYSAVESGTYYSNTWGGSDPWSASGNIKMDDGSSQNVLP